MDFIGLVAALVGLAVLYWVFVLANKISNRWARYLALIVGILVAISVAGNVPMLLGERDVATIRRAGEYVFAIGVLLAIVSTILRRKKSK
jgi:predicted benzoate:H+ symporter BenE